MNPLRVIHLVDDLTAGGVMRVLHHMLTAPELSQRTRHCQHRIDRRALWPGRFKADVIVSHLAINWRILPLLALLRLLHPRATLVHVEHSYTEGFVALNVPCKHRFAALLRIAYKLFHRIVAVSEAQGRWLIGSGAVRAGALSVIPSCVDLSSFRALDPAPSDVRVIGAIGRLDRQKGFDTLIRAFRGVDRQDVALHIYGEGAEEPALRDLAAGDPRITFMGFASDPVAAMAAVDAIAMPSQWEAYGLVAIEAFAAGRPLLVNTIDGMTDHIANGALAVGDMSAEGWRAAIENLLRNPAPASQSIRRDGFEARFASGWKSLLRRA